VLAWRLCREPFADLSGQGAALFGGRWNSPGRPLVYAASTAALAVLEVRVHLDLPPELLPEDYRLLTIDLDGLTVEVLSDLPPEPRAFGDAWLAAGRTAVLQVPSAIVPESPNLLLNPRHPDAGAARILARRHFAFDSRLWGINDGGASAASG
jgi:RES domain-containing protein